MLSTKLVSTPEELDQIAHLNSLNLVTNISPEDKAKNGFVTWSYPAEDLRALHEIAPSVIAVDDAPESALGGPGADGNAAYTTREADSGLKVIGFALTLVKESLPAFPRMQGTLEHLSKVVYEGKPLDLYRFYLMGQICVAENYRGKGVVGMLYQFHREHFAGKFDLLVTEISTSNLRSQKAHEKVGFKTINTYRDSSDEWNVVVWDWR
jgi:ribosomal protein S18 acetylase RimI-like enzyme